MQKNRRILVIFFFGFFILGSCNSQSEISWKNSNDTLYIPEINDTIEVEEKDGIREYYSLVHKAEFSIMDSNYTEAVDLYLQAFSYAVPYRLDVMNALKAAYFGEVDSASVIKIITFFRKTSENISFRDDLKYLNEMFPDFKKCSYYDNIKRCIKSTDIYLDPELASVIDSISNIDQKYRLKGIKEKGWGYMYSSYRDKILRNDSLIPYILCELYEKYGEIPHYRIGVSRVTAILGILSHSIGQKNYLWFPYLKRETYSGNFDCRLYMHIIDRAYANIVRPPINNSTSVYFTGNGFALYDKYIIIDINDFLDREANIRRENVFGESL
ncbi:MAG: hypothetical protein ABIJ16_01315, partial [Bacteroidota bacterium]